MRNYKEFAKEFWKEQNGEDWKKVYYLREVEINGEPHTELMTKTFVYVELYWNGERWAGGKYALQDSEKRIYDYAETQLVHEMRIKSTLKMANGEWKDYVAEYPAYAEITA